ncbi:MAG: glycosyltransferase [Chitinophagaceae bacterium]|nr:MAG: glycosyltransferase [Chitinophagaceae bacterium]
MGKKIVFTVINDLNNDRRMHRICATLFEAGYDVTLVGRELPDSKPIIKRPFQQYRLKCNFHAGKLFYVEYNLRLFKWLTSRDFDIYGAVDVDTAMAVLRVSEQKKKPFVLDLHEYFSEVPEVINRALVKRFWKFIEKKAIRKADLVYTVSDNLAKIFEEQHHRKVYTIKNVPVYTGNNVLRKYPAAKFNIIYQGALNEGRGLENLIDAMEWVDAELYIAGEGDLSEKLKTQANKKSYNSRIHFLGMLTPEKLALQTQKADLGINILESKSLSYYYSLANKFFDYIHAGIPQICMGYPEYKSINNNFDIALLIDSFAIEKLVESMNEIISNKNLYNRLAENCIKASENLNWQNESLELLQLINNFD